jgi:hypothetical protein
MPCTYHLSISQKSAIVHVFRDGSVTIVSPGTEMGQGLQTKVMQTAAHELSKVRGTCASLGCGSQPAVICPTQLGAHTQLAAVSRLQALPEGCVREVPLELLRLAEGDTQMLPHLGFSAGSTTSEQVRAYAATLHSMGHCCSPSVSDTCDFIPLLPQACEAVRLACRELVGRLQPFAEKLAPGSTWQQLVGSTMSMFIGLPPRVPMTAWAHGGLVPAVGQKNAFGGYGYQVYGAAISEVELDVLTGGWLATTCVCVCERWPYPA